MKTLKPHQLETIRKMHNGCIVTGGVGTGKTLTALGYYYTKIAGGSLNLGGSGEWAPPTRPTDLYVITTVKNRNDLTWEGEAASLAISTTPGVGVGGINMVVDSWNNIGKYEHIKGAFFVFDEQRLVGSGAWTKSFYKIAAANQWVILSATPGDVWMDYVPVFIANGYFKNRTEFNSNHVIYSRYAKFPKVERYVGTQTLERYRDRILVEMPFERHTERLVKYIPVEYNQENYDTVVKKRWNIFEDEPLKDVSQMFVAMRRVVNSDPSRLGATLKLIEEHPRLIIFYNFNYELEMLRTLANLGVVVAEWNGQKHEPVPDGDRWVYLVQYTAGAEGWNCTTTDATLFWSLNYSYKINEQAKGRTDRLNTPFTYLNYYILLSKSPLDSKIIQAVRTKKDFNERRAASDLGVPSEIPPVTLAKSP